MAILRAYLFGGLSLVWDEVPLPPVPGATTRSLLAYLLTHRGQAHTRDLLAGTFWSDLPEAAARRRLSQALWLIRSGLGKALPTDLLRTEGDTVQINPNLPLWTDMAEFEQQAGPQATRLGSKGQVPTLAASNLLLLAVDLYRGDFLAGYYDDWLLVERERLREQFLVALAHLVAGYKQQGDYERALIYARRLAGEDPWREEAHREIMRLCHVLDRDAEALEQFEICCQILKDEFDASPEPETVALAQEITQPATLEAAPYLPQSNLSTLRVLGGDAGPDQLPLVGRRQERAVLISHLEAAINSLGGLVLIEGPAGVGKTRLLQELARDAEWRDLEVLWGQSRELGGVAPFGPWLDALKGALTPLRVEQWAQLVEPIWLRVLRPLLPELAAVAPEPAPSLEPERERERLVNAFTQLLAAWGRVVPLLLILEDLHRADEDSLTLLIALGRRLKAHKVLIVGSYRGHEARARPPIWERLQTLHRAGWHARLSLSPLDAEASSELIRRSLGVSEAAPLFETRLYRETGGNPLFILESLRALHDEGLLFQDAGGRWGTPWDETTTAYDELLLPPAVEQVIARRVAQLSSQERAVLETAAVLGSSFSFRLLQETSGQEADTLLPAVQTLVHRHFLIEQPAAYEFGHDQMRHVVYHSLAPEVRRTRHRQVVRALETQQPDRTAFLAHHLARGEIWDRAVETYLASGQAAAAVYATEAALRAYGQAVDILQNQHPFPEDQAARLHFDLLAARCPLLRLQGRQEAYRVDVETMLALAQALREPDRQVEALLQQAEFLGESACEYEAASRAAEQALALAQQHGLHQREARAWMLIGSTWKEQGHNQPALEAYEHALTAYRASPSGRGGEVEVYAGLVMAYRDLGDLERAQEMAQVALEKARAYDDPLAMIRVYNALAWIARARGNHQAEAEHCQAALEWAQAIGHRYYEGVALNNLGLAHNALGEHGPAIEATQRALDIFCQIDHLHGQVITRLNLSSRYKNTGQLPLAGQVLAEALPPARELALADDEARILSSLGELLTNTGEYEAAREVLAEAEQVAGDLDSPLLQATVQYRWGELCLAVSDWCQAAKRFERALCQYEASGYTHYQIVSRSRLAACRQRQGDLAQAVALSTQAMAEMDARSDSPLILETCLHHYQVMAAAGQPEMARQALDRAYAEVQARCATLPDPAWQQRFIQDVPVHHEIVAAWQALQPRPITVRLPRAEAPTGRPLRDDEYVTVTWTVHALEDEAIEGKVARRRARLCRLLREATDQGAAPTVDDLAEALAVSPGTLKRDLAALRQAGYEVKTRGSRRSWQNDPKVIDP